MDPLYQAHRRPIRAPPEWEVICAWPTLAGVPENTPWWDAVNLRTRAGFSAEWETLRLAAQQRAHIEEGQRRIPTGEADRVRGQQLQQEGLALLERAETETRQLEEALSRAQSVLEKLENGQTVNDDELIPMPNNDDFPF